MADLTYAELNKRFNTAIPYLAAENARLLYPEALTAELSVLLTQWNAIYALAENKATRTAVMVAQRQDEREVLDRLYRQMQQTLKQSPTVALTETDFAALFIHKNKHRARIPPPTIIPKIDVIGRAENTIKIQLPASGTFETSHRRLPDGVEFVNVFVALALPSEPLPTEADYQLMTTQSKALISLKFAKTAQKKMAYIQAQFGNKNGVSQRSNTTEAVVPI